VGHVSPCDAAYSAQLCSFWFSESNGYLAVRESIPDSYSPDSKAWSFGTTMSGNQGRLRLPQKAAPAEGRPKGAGAPMNQSREAHLAARPLHSPRGHASMHSNRNLASEAGGRVGVCPGLYDNPHRRSLTGSAHSSSRLAPIRFTQSSR